MSNLPSRAETAHLVLVVAVGYAMWTGAIGPLLGASLMVAIPLVSITSLTTSWLMLAAWVVLSTVAVGTAGGVMTAEVGAVAAAVCHGAILSISGRAQAPSCFVEDGKFIEEAPAEIKMNIGQRQRMLVRAHLN